MDIELIQDIFIDALRDSSLVFAFVFVIHLLLSYYENSLSNFIVRRKKSGSFFGALFGLIPQCGTSVIAADLYIKKYISLGVICAIFLSCSDEAFITILASGSEKTFMILPLIAIKFGIGFLTGILVDLLFKKQDITSPTKSIEHHTCHVHDKENTDLHQHLIHPLLHSLEIFLYVFVINVFLGLVIALVGQDNFANFLNANKYLTPLYSCIIGLIPNCASSLLLAELFIEGSLPFGSLLAGLLVNAGLGMMMLLRNRKSAKHLLVIVLVCFFVAIISGYIACLISGF